MELCDLTIQDASSKIAKGEITSLDITLSCLKRIEEREKDIHAFISICTEQAIAKAKEIDSLPKSKKTSPLSGIPYSVKDVYMTKGIQTTAGSKILEGYIGQYDATVVKKLNEAGAVLIGKTNCDPFGFGSSTEHSGYGITRNPIDPTKVPGGSSGGSAASVAYGGGLFSIAEDTGGSIRCPSSFCGVVGLKPTYGRVSRYGAIAYASSYDSVGPITKTVTDLALVMQTIAGKDPMDATTPQEPVPDYSKTLGLALENKKIGIPKEYFTEGLDEEVRKSINLALKEYESSGCELVDISLPLTEYAISIYYIIGLSEASSNLARFDGIRFGPTVQADDWSSYMEQTRGKLFGDEEKRRIMIGTHTLSSGYQDKYYKRAQALREQLRADFRSAFNQVDIIATPTMPMLPFTLGENLDDPLKMWLADAYTVSINPVGLPAISVPSFKSQNGLPVGLQLIAPHFKEEVLFNFAHYLEQKVAV